MPTADQGNALFLPPSQFTKIILHLLEMLQHKRLSANQFTMARSTIVALHGKSSWLPPCHQSKEAGRNNEVGQTFVGVV